MTAATPDCGSEADRRPWYHHVEEGLLVLLVGALLLLAFGQILLRNFLGVTWVWSEPLVRHLVLWSSFLGALIATRDNRHIRIDAALRLLQPRLRLIATAVGNVISATVCLLLAPLAARFVLDEYNYGGSAFLSLPRWTLLLVFPVVFCGMGLRFAGHGVAQLRNAVCRQSPGN